MNSYKFTDVNTTGYIVEQLDKLNEELAQRLDSIEVDSDEYHQTAKAFQDEVSRRLLKSFDR